MTSRDPKGTLNGAHASLNYCARSLVTGGHPLSLTLFPSGYACACGAGPSSRNKDMEAIRDGLAFPPTAIDAGSSPSAATAAPPPTSLDAHDMVIWCGDLNYRLDMKDEDARALAAQSDWSAMLAADELRQNAASGGVWAAFEEGTIGFPPTYKYDLNSDGVRRGKRPCYRRRPCSHCSCSCVCACTPCGRVRHVVEAACAGLDGPHSLEARLAGRDFLLHAP